MRAKSVPLKNNVTHPQNMPDESSIAIPNPPVALSNDERLVPINL
jgi:hypothetical protein